MLSGFRSLLKKATGFTFQELGAAVAFVFLPATVAWAVRGEFDAAYIQRLEGDISSLEKAGDGRFSELLTSLNKISTEINTQVEGVDVREQLEKENQRFLDDNKNLQSKVEKLEERNLELEGIFQKQFSTLDEFVIIEGDSKALPGASSRVGVTSVQSTYVRLTFNKNRNTLNVAESLDIKVSDSICSLTLLRIVKELDEFVPSFAFSCPLKSED